MSLCCDSIVSFRIVNPAASFRAPINFLHLISPFSTTTWLKGISGICLLYTSLQEAFQHKILRHICNTAGIERYPGAQFDMVRLGIGLYGIDPFTNQIIHNVSTLKTTILQIHEVPKEETVGYSRKGHLERDSRIAAIPIGYADGLNRRLGNGHAYCLVNGQKAPYVGNICMDVCMIDVTDIDCKEGDKAIIFGDDLPVTVLSEILETIPYEILTSVSNLSLIHI